AVALQQEVTDAGLVVQGGAIILLHGSAIVINGIKKGLFSTKFVALLLQFLCGRIFRRRRYTHGRDFRLGRGGWNGGRLLCTEWKGDGEQDNTTERAEATHGGLSLLRRPAAWTGGRRLIVLIIVLLVVSATKYSAPETLLLLWFRSGRRSPVGGRVLALGLNRTPIGIRRRRSRFRFQA